MNITPKVDCLASFNLTLDDVVENGILQEINRLLLHPRGLTLTAGRAEDDRALMFITTQFAGKGGTYFAPDSNHPWQARAEAFENMATVRATDRLEVQEELIQNLDELANG